MKTDFRYQFLSVLARATTVAHVLIWAIFTIFNAIFIFGNNKFSPLLIFWAFAPAYIFIFVTNDNIDIQKFLAKAVAAAPIFTFISILVVDVAAGALLIAIATPDSQSSIMLCLVAAGVLASWFIIAIAGYALKYIVLGNR